ncbi:hypothetical protein F4780DRAFT_431121 [Xylariomycetidae sp. FL0641]|nr:hypothetical protein F4780DRAFT_431121 [Xylariomycetidae sp. FL0641]
MAGTSPTRRSSRARTTQSQSHNSSATSSASGRAERATRAFTKTGSPQKSTGSGSLSSEPPEDSTTTTTNDDPVVRRRSMRGKDEDREKQTKSGPVNMPPASDEIQEDDEAVRCICGKEDYPGPPPFDESPEHSIKDSIDHRAIFAIEVTDDMAGFFVQCEICNTWQHGACVGFTTEESNPDDVEYFCEQCRKDLHKVYTASNGQKYSVFLPIHPPVRTASRGTSASKEGARSPKGKDGKPSRSGAANAAHTTKRRSTMNSRDAAYDEEELLRRAIEASKEDAIPEESEPLSRRPKRGRDDSEECATKFTSLESIPDRSYRKSESVKRQRTDSKSPSPAGDKTQNTAIEDSDDDTATRNGASKKNRSAARNQRERAERDERREEQERKRAEAASKRKGRAERRRADDSDPSDELPLASRASATRATESAQPPEPPLPSSQPPPDTPPATHSSSISHKKKSVHTKKKGRNQYTKDRDTHEHDEAPGRSMSRDITRNGDETSASHGKPSGHEGVSKNSKSKGAMSSRITMSDMKRRIHGFLEYISRTQLELANDPLSESRSNPDQSPTDEGSGSTTSKTNANADGNGNMPAPNGTTTSGSLEAVLPTKDFKDMTCVEMMDSLTRDLYKWKRDFAP